MSALLLAPYNDSMRLGAGYNSFLQTPCLGNAVLISEALVTTSKAGSGQNGTSQTVAYAASFVEKMSEVVRTMNISAGSSIRTGSVNVSAGSSSIDEAKFTDSDLNAVLSVKVVNQTRVLKDQVEFNPLNVSNMNSEIFHNTYGDTFISGFIEGGDLHGIVSMKILESSRKSEIKKSIKSQFNGPNNEWSPTNSGELSSLMTQTEVTITVNYSGGGTIKDAAQEWTLPSLMATAAAFPDNVANCPQRTFAVLSRYNTVPSFVKWANQLTTPIVVRRYEGVQRYTSELLDTFIEYKSNLYLLNDAIRHPELYYQSSAEDAIEVTLKAMVAERRELKSVMETMVQRIEALDKDPSQITNFISSRDIPEPELQRARLPMKRDVDSEKEAEEMLRNLWGISGGDGKGDVTDPTKMQNDFELKETKEKLETANASLQEAQKTIERLQGELKSAQASGKSDADKVARWADYDTMKAAKEQAESSANQARSEAEQYKNLWNSIPEVNIITMIIEANRDVGDHLLNNDARAAIERRIRTQAKHEQLGTGIFGGYDPFVGSRKWMRIIYQRRGEGQRRVEGWEGEYRDFD